MANNYQSPEIVTMARRLMEEEGLTPDQALAKAQMIMDLPEEGLQGAMTGDALEAYKMANPQDFVPNNPPPVPSSRPGPLDYSTNLMPGNIPQPKRSMVMDNRGPAGAGAYVEQVNTPNPVQRLPGNMGKNPCAMMPGTVWNGKACVPATLYNIGFTI